MGSGIGMFAVRMRHRQPTPVLARDLMELQQSAVGEVVPLALLLVMKLKHGVKLEIIEGEHGVETWARAGTIRAARAMASTERMRDKAMIGFDQLIWDEGEGLKLMSVG